MTLMSTKTAKIMLSGEMSRAAKSSGRALTASLPRLGGYSSQLTLSLWLRTLCECPALGRWRENGVREIGIATATLRQVDGNALTVEVALPAGLVGNTGTIPLSE